MTVEMGMEKKNQMKNNNKRYTKIVYSSGENNLFIGGKKICKCKKKQQQRKRNGSFFTREYECVWTFERKKWRQLKQQKKTKEKYPNKDTMPPYVRKHVNNPKPVPD